MEAEIRRYSSDRQRRRLNNWAILLISFLTVFADSLIFPIIIGSAYVWTLSSRYEVVGLLPAVTVGGFLAVQPLVNRQLPRRQQKPFVVAAQIVRCLALIFVAWDVSKAPTDPDTRVRNVLIGLLIFAIASGATAAPSQALLGRAVPLYRRQSLIRNRRITAGLAAIAAGAVVYNLFSFDGPDYPRNFTTIFGAAALFSGVAAFLTTQIREPSRVADHRERRYHGGLFSPLQESPFRRMLLFRLGLATAAIADPFFVIYLVQELQLPRRYFGIFIVAVGISVLFSAIGWHWLRGRGSARTVMQGAAFVRLLPPLIALTLVRLRDSSFYQDHSDNLEWLHIASIAIFVAIGASIAAQIGSHFEYVGNLTRTASQTGYRDLINLSMALAGFLSVVGGVIIQRRDFDTLFLVAGAAALISIFLSGLLEVTRPINYPAATGIEPARR